MIKIITEEQKDDMLHALGRPTLRKNWKPKTILDNCYRNRYVDYRPYKPCEELVKLGFMNVQIQNTKTSHTGKMYFYYVTLKGMEYLCNKKRDNN